MSRSGGVRLRIGPALVGTMMLVAACSTSETTTETSSPASHVDHYEEAPHFAYQGEHGPQAWAKLWPDSCGAGNKAQSPIDITTAVESSDQELPDLGFDYRDGDPVLLNNEHTVEAKYDGGSGSTVEIDGEKYDLVGFHFHANSEHAIDGKHEPMELHLVHKTSNGRTAVVGVLLTPGEANPAYAPVLDNLPAEKSGTHKLEQVNPEAFLPANRTFYHYIGSLTTPGCNPDVSWQVMTNPVELSPEQIAEFQKLYPDNARPVQPLNGREVEVSGPVQAS